MTCLLLPQDLTIAMDVELNPGPEPYRRCRAGRRVKERRSFKKYKIEAVILRHHVHGMTDLHKGSKLNNLRQPIPNRPLKYQSLAHFALWNARSISRNSTFIYELLLPRKNDILALTETWLNGDQRDDRVIAELMNTLKVYDIYHVPRLGRSGGGIAIIAQKGFDIKILDDSRSFVSFEYD